MSGRPTPFLTVDAPLRLSLAGGGSDLPEWYRFNGCRLMAVTINRRVRVAILRAPAEPASEPLLGVFLDRHGKDYSVVVSSAVTAGAGLGGSGAVAVCLVAADAALRSQRMTSLAIAREAYRWERELTMAPVGFQDHVAAAVGGLVTMRANPDGTIEAEPDAALGLAFDHMLRTSIVLVDSRERRAAAPRLHRLAGRLGHTSLSGMASVDEVAEVLRRRDGAAFGLILDRHWKAKQALLGATSTTRRLDELMFVARAAGATGAKVVGAGGGGVVMIAGPEGRRAAVAGALYEQGHAPLPVAVDTAGVKIQCQRMMT